MTWGIIILHKEFIGYSSLVMADDSAYEFIKKDSFLGFVYGIKGIEDKKINDIANRVNNLVRRLNNGDAVDIGRELESA